MNDTATINTGSALLNTDIPGTGRRVSLVGVPLGFGCSMPGVDMGPAAIRVALLGQRISGLGFEVRDLGDLHIERPKKIADSGDPVKYLREMVKACEQLASVVTDVLKAGELPIIIGGDHSIAIGSISGAALYFKERRETFGLL